jgi:tRNA uridine 5-carbamoylmethylation protein Kti12
MEIITDRKVLYILRGLPWCGKSYLAKQLLAEYKARGVEGVIHSTDEYFYKIRHPHEPEKYSYHPHFIVDAHRWNQQRSFRLIEMGHPLIIIDNTNTLPREAKPYVEYALPQDYVVRIEEPTSDRWKEISLLLYRKNDNEQKLKDWSYVLEQGSKETHSVPAWAIQRMMWRWHNNMTVQDVLDAPAYRED